MAVSLHALFLLAVVAAMVWDVATFEIPDTVSLVLAGGFVAGGLLAGSAPATLLAHAVAGLVLLAAGVVLHAFGLWGGRRRETGWRPRAVVRLAGAAGLADPGLAGGGLLALAVLGLRRLTVPAGAPAWLARLAAPGEGIPYGVALGGGALLAQDGALRFLPAMTG